MRYKTFICWAIGVFALWFISGFLMTAIWGVDGRGTAGDMFGAINSLFSGLAFAGIIYTIVIQREELKLQREELKLQREEVAKSREELSGQKEMMNLQRVEVTLFNLINVHNQVVESFKYKNYVGRDVFEYIAQNLKVPEQRRDEELTKFFNEFQKIEFYYSNFIYILQFITDNATIDNKAKSLYTSVFLAQATKDQILAIGCYARYKELRGDMDIQHHLALLKNYKVFDLK